VTAEDVLAVEALPAFNRSTVDGYAVRAEDTYGANESQPAYLNLLGEVLMGTASELKLSPGQCALIHTGGAIPENANAVVMLEETQPVRFTGTAQRTEIEVMKAVAAWENTLRIGEEISPGQVVIGVGQKIGAAEIRALMALGISKVNVLSRPRVAIISSGDELVHPTHTPGRGQVRDVNSYSLAALVAENGGEPVLCGILPDQRDLLLTTARQAFDACHLLVISAGSSASARDLTAEIIDALGEPGILIHGVSLRPGKPVILAVCNHKPVIGLPGNPLSALVAARLFLVPAILKLSGLAATPSEPTIKVRMAINVASQAGREDWIPVRFVSAQASSDRWVEPVYGKSNFILNLARADGLVCIPPASNGLEAGAQVEMFPC